MRSILESQKPRLRKRPPAWGISWRLHGRFDSLSRIYCRQHGSNYSKRMLWFRNHYRSNAWIGRMPITWFSLVKLALPEGGLCDDWSDQNGWHLHRFRHGRLLPAGTQPALCRVYCPRRLRGSRGLSTRKLQTITPREPSLTACCCGPATLAAELDIVTRD